MSDTLVIAISQSGTTTDTNRSVDLVRSRGAAVVAIVNRRNSDLVDRSDGVLYTSDGRDVEMSVASTKAFYSQVAAGLPPRARHRVGRGHARRRPRARAAHRAARAARRDAPRSSTSGPSSLRSRPHVLSRRVVGGGRQRPQPHRRARAADQALGALLQGDRLRRHRGQEAHRPVVGADDARVRGGPRRLEHRRRRQGDRDLPRAPRRADRDRERGPSRRPLRRRGRGDLGAGGAPRARLRALARWPATCSATRPRSRSTPRPVRCARPAPRSRPVPPAPSTTLLVRLAPAIEAPGPPVPRGPARRTATTARSRRAPASGSRRCCATPPAISPLDAYELEHGKVGTPSTVVQDLTAALTRGIEELTRPIDAIKHQAKTVTVGISRSDETLLHVPLVAADARRGRAARRAQLPRAAHARRRSTPRSRRSPGSRATGSRATPAAPTPRCTSSTAAGVAVGLVSRTDADPRLTGTKHRVADTARGHRGARGVVTGARS